ncbi:hypothetical protein [Clostridium tertium]|uniref:Uncharacterized protein n=1 Tax=Clostridium tertium TaxID=1559 RepID=A0A6N3ERV2_9CLOT
MGFKDKVSKYFTDAYMQKYGDRMTSTAGTVLSVKIEEKNILGIFRKLNAIILLKPDAGKGVVKTQYKVRKWFKKPAFIDVKQGHKVIIMGIEGEKGKADSEIITISNILNLTTKKDLHPFDHSQIKKARQQATKMRTR